VEGGANIWESTLLVFAGWALSTLTTILGILIVRRGDKRRLFMRVFLVIEKVLISLELAPAWRKAGGLETVPQILGVDEEWRNLVPPPAPSLPDDFTELLVQIADWEASRGKSDLTKKLQALRGKLQLLHSLHAGLMAQAQHGAKHISESGIGFFDAELPEIKELCHQILHLVYPMRLGAPAKAKRWFMKHVRRNRA